MKLIRINQNINNVGIVFNFSLMNHPTNKIFNSPILNNMGRFIHDYKIKELNKKLLSIKWIILNMNKITNIYYKFRGFKDVELTTYKQINPYFSPSKKIFSTHMIKNIKYVSRNLK